jgi:hypothetical protein
MGVPRIKWFVTLSPLWPLQGPRKCKDELTGLNNMFTVLRTNRLFFGVSYKHLFFLVIQCSKKQELISVKVQERRVTQLLQPRAWEGAIMPHSCPPGPACRTSPSINLQFFHFKWDCLSIYLSIYLTVIYLSSINQSAIYLSFICVCIHLSVHLPPALCHTLGHILRTQWHHVCLWGI